jgi:hypothetical protein
MVQRKRLVFDDKTGKFAPTSGPTAEVLPQHMRGLPGEITTKDAAEGDKVHPDDPPHIVKSIIHEQAKRLAIGEQQNLPDAVKQLSEATAPVGERVPVNQARVDVVRFRIIRSRINRLCDEHAKLARMGVGMPLARFLKDMPVDHVWFAKNNVNAYELRRGLPPPNFKRPAHLKSVKLEIDILNWPESVLDALKAMGHTAPNIPEMLLDAERRTSVLQELGREEGLIWTPR